MLFEAPDIIRNIPDIAEIYRINDKQIDELEQAAEQLDNDILLTTMGEDKVERWEKMLGTTAFDDDTIEDRRFRIQARVTEKLPYSYRIVVRRLNILCPDGYMLDIDDAKTSVIIKLTLKSKKMINDVSKMIDDILPLNMIYKVTILWNQHSMTAHYTHKQLADRKHKQIREEIFENGK